MPMFRSHLKLSCARGGAAGRLRRQGSLAARAAPRALEHGGSHNMGTINCVSFLL